MKISIPKLDEECLCRPIIFVILPLSCWEAYLNFPTGRYRVFLGHKQYFVSSDVGAGKMQWYGFHQEPAGGADIPNGNCTCISFFFNHYIHLPCGGTDVRFEGMLVYCFQTCKGV